MKSLLCLSLLVLGAGLDAGTPAVSIVKSANKATAKVFETYRYSIVVDNTGSATATATTISDVIPAGLNVVAISPGGVQVGNTITWNLGNLFCQNQIVTLTAIADTNGGWGDYAQVAGSEDSWALSTLGGAVSSTNNWFYLQSLSGYSVNTVNSVRLYYEWHGNNASDTVSTSFSNDGDLNTKEGTGPLVAGLAQATDRIESWNITGIAGPWNFNKLQFLAVYLQHNSSGGGAHDAWMDRVWAVADFQSCGTSVWYDVVVGNTLFKGDVVNNTADVSGSNFSTVGSANVAVTVDGPLVALTKTASPSLAAPGEIVRYTLDYSNFVTGLSVFDDFADNWGTGVAIIPSWSGASSNPEFWQNSTGKMWHTGCGYSPLWRDDTGNFSDGTVSVDILMSGNGSGNANASLMYLYQDSGPDIGKFYKSKLYTCGGSPTGYCVDVQTGPAWNQICGNAYVTNWNPGTWNNLKVVISNYTFYVYVNNILMFTCDDPTNYLTAPGKAGVYNDGDCTYYDNFRIGQDNPAFNVRFWDTLDPCVTYVGSTPTATVAGNYLFWNVGTLQGGQSGQAYYDVRVNAACAPGTVVPNTARGRADNAPLTQDNGAFTVIMPVQKSASPSSASPNDTVSFSIVYTATGGGAIVTDDHADGTFSGRWISQQARYSSITEAGGVINYSGNVQDEFTAVGSDGRDGLVSADILVKEGGRNGLLLGYQGGRYYYLATFYDYNANDDFYELHYFNGTVDSTLQTFGPTQIDPTNGSPSGSTYNNLKVVREANRFRVYLNNSYVTTFTDAANNLPNAGLQGYLNHGGDWKFDNFRWEPGVKAGVTVCDTMPSCFTWLGGTGSPTFSSNIACWALPDLSPAQSVTVSFGTRVSACAAALTTNTARATQLSGVTYTGTALVTVSMANITIAKSISRTTYAFGETVTYCINWTSSGTSPAVVNLWDTLSPILTYQGSTNAGSLQVIGGNNVVVWNLGSQAPGASGTVCVWGTITAYPLNPFESPKLMWAWLKQKWLELRASS